MHTPRELLDMLEKSGGIGLYVEGDLYLIRDIPGVLEIIKNMNRQTGETPTDREILDILEASGVYELETIKAFNVKRKKLS